MNDKRLAKIQALLAQAERTNHPEEAKTFTAKAQELMTAWAIDEAMLDGHRASSTDELGVTEIWLDLSPYALVWATLLNTAAKANDCTIVRFTGQYKRDESGEFVPAASGRGWQKGTIVKVFGFASGRQATQMLYASLLLQSETEYRTPAVQARMLAAINHPGERMRWRNGFMMGYAAGVHDKLQAARAHSVKDAGVGAELVLSDRKALVKQYAKDNVGKTTKSTSSAGSGGGYKEGYARGSRADVGQNRVGGNSQRSIG